MSVLFPILPPLGRKILISISALPVLYALYYMIVIPGWMPRNGGHIKPVLRFLAFLVLAVTIVAGVLMFVLSE